MSGAVATIQPRSVLLDMAGRFGMEPQAFEATLRATVVPDKCSREQFAAFLLVAKEYNLNPLTKEIYAFPARTGGIQPIVSIDGWCNLINSQPALDGVEFDDHLEGNKVTAITCRIWRKDRQKPIVVTEYLAECQRSTDPWKQYPRRMLRHKALIQAARYAFGFAGIVDPDEAERIADASPMKTVNHTDTAPPAPPQIASQPSVPVEIIQPEPEKDALEIPAALKRTKAKPIIEASVNPHPSEDPEGWLKWIDATLGAVTDPDKLAEVWENKIEPTYNDAFPPDQEEAMGRYRRHEARLAE